MQIPEVASLSQILDTTKPEIDVHEFSKCPSSSAATCGNDHWTFSASTWDAESGVNVD
jgi:hypothetical protein